MTLNHCVTKINILKHISDNLNIFMPEKINLNPKAKENIFLEIIECKIYDALLNF